MINVSKKERFEKFAQLIAGGMKYNEALLKVDPNAKKFKQCTINSRASHLAKATKERVVEIRKEMAEQGLWTRVQSVKALVDIVNDEKTKKSDRVNAVKELNNMHGFHAPQEINHNLSQLDDILSTVIKRD